MLKALGFKLLFTAIQLIISKELFTQIYELVSSAARLDIEGEEKKALVLKELEDVKTTFKKSFGAAGSALLNLVIEVVYAQFNIAIGKLKV